MLRLHGDDQAEAHPVAQAAKKCGTAIADQPFTAFRVKVRSFDLGTDITGILAAPDNKIIWLESDQQGWAEPDYIRVMKLAIAEAETRLVCTRRALRLEARGVGRTERRSRCLPARQALAIYERPAAQRLRKNDFVGNLIITGAGRRTSRLRSDGEGHDDLGLAGANLGCQDLSRDPAVTAQPRDQRSEPGGRATKVLIRLEKPDGGVASCARARRCRGRAGLRGRGQTCGGWFIGGLAS